MPKSHKPPCECACCFAQASNLKNRAVHHHGLVSLSAMDLDPDDAIEIAKACWRSESIAVKTIGSMVHRMAMEANVYNIAHET